MKEQVIIVDKKDRILTIKDKQYAHINGLRHRAISVFIFNKKNELMIQKRSADKYHSSLLWANTCCGHPRYGEIILQAAHRRLKEEMGFDCFLTQKFYFTYKSELDNGLIEHEFDYVFLGRYEGIPHINYNEVADWRWISLKKLIKEIHLNSNKYVVWLKIIIDKYLEKLKL